jgi:putative component of membrane protein insertase Oxa1/YidC/SpoIIIJ protein YidD
MIEALRVHGSFKGTALGLWRLLRCHPFGKSGYDPVPQKGRWTVDVSNLEKGIRK